MVARSISSWNQIQVWLPRVDLVRMRVLGRFPLLAALCTVATGCQPSLPRHLEPPTTSQSDVPLAVQKGAKYVTDPHRWGMLIFPWEEIRVEGGSATDANDLASLIETYHRAWLSRDSEGIEKLLDSEIVRFRDGRLALGIEDVSRLIADESRGERPEGYAGSTELPLRWTASSFLAFDTLLGLTLDPKVSLRSNP